MKLIQLFTRFYIAMMILGFILILLAVSTGIRFPGMDDEIIPDEASRIMALSSGLLLIVFSIVTYFVETKKRNDTMILTREKRLNRNELTETQRKLLYDVELHCIEYEAINQMTIESKHDKMTGSELYYRLECLILQGYLIKDSAGVENHVRKYIYRLSPKYCEQFNITIKSSESTKRA